MADSFVQLNNDGPGKKIDTRTESTNGDHRQVMVIGDPNANANVANVTAAGGVQVDGSSVTQPISAVSLPLPAGAATSANQATAQSSLSTIATNTPPVGQAAMAASSPVVIASNQSSVPVTVGNFPATQAVSGTVTANAGTGTFAISAASLPLPAGAATASNQTTAQTSLSTIAANTAQLATTQPVSVASLPLPSGAATAANQTSVIGSASGGSASTNSLLSGGQFNTVLPTLTNTQQAAIQLDSNARAIISPLTSLSTVTVVQPTGTNLHAVLDSGTLTGITNPVTVSQAMAANLNATVTGTVTSNQGTANTATNAWPTKLVDSGGVNVASINATNELLVTDNDLTQAQGSATSGQLGPLIQGAVTTAAPSYSTAQTSPLSLTLAGALRTDASATTQPISGTITANQGTANATPWNSNTAQIAGTATSTAAAGTQKVGITGNTAAILDAVITATTAPANALATLSVNNTTPPSLTTGQSVALQSDYEGSLFVKPYRRAQTTSKATTIAASTTATTVLAAQAAGIFADISSLIVTATPGATGTAFTVTLSDGTNSYIYDMDTGSTTTLVQNGILNITFNPPLPATTAATAWTLANSSATPTIHVTVVAVLQKAS